MATPYHPHSPPAPTFEDFQTQHPSPVSCPFTRPLLLDDVLAAYRAVYTTEVDAAVASFDAAIAGAAAEGWMVRWEMHLKDFETAACVLWHIAALHYPVTIQWDSKARDYQVAVELAMFLLKVNVNPEDEVLEIKWSDFFIHFSATMTDDERRCKLMTAIESYHLIK